MAKIYGTNSSNLLTATAAGDALYGWAKANAPGNEGPATDADTLIGGRGDDTIWGGAGADVISGGAGKNQLFGGAGNDRVSLLLDLGADSAEGAEGVDLLVLDGRRQKTDIDLDLSDATETIGLADGTVLTGFERLNFLGGSGDDYVISGSLADRLSGGLGDDRLVAGDGQDRIWGQAGADRIYGEEGNDRLYGGQGADALGGGLGNDTLSGGAGRDTLFGQDGEDQFVFAHSGARNRDVIDDFDVADDQIQLAASLFDDLAAGALQKARFVLGTEAKDADDRVIYSAETGEIWLDLDGNGKGAKVLLAELDINLALTAADFMVF